MSKPEKPGPNAGKHNAVRVAFALFTVALVLVSGIAVLEYLNHNVPRQQSGFFPSEPMPALWQSNFSGTPSTIETSANGTVYFLVDSNTSWNGEAVNWQLYSIQLSTGKILWEHNISIYGAGNAKPQLYLHGGQLYFIGPGGNGSVNSSIAGRSNSPYAIYVVQYNQSTGSTVRVQAIDTSVNFSVSGIFAVYGSYLYTAWTSWDSSEINVAAYTPFSDITSSSPKWNITITQPANESSTPVIFVDSKVLLLPLGELMGLDPINGKQIFSAPYSSLGTDEYNTENGALLNSTFYFVSELGVGGRAVNFHLMGMELPSMKIIANVTVSKSSSGLEPLPVRAYGSELAVATDLSGNYVVTSLGGKILWSSQSVLAGGLPGNSNIEPWNPVLVMGNGNWILTSVSWPPGNSGIATQYFSEANPSNGSVLWVHQFSFVVKKGQTEYLPPDLYQQPMVLLLGSSSHYLIYRWGNAVGCAAV